MPTTQECRDCGEHFPYDEDADRCPSCVADMEEGGITYVMGNVNAYCLKCSEQGGITEEGQALGHWYVMGNVNAYCLKCSEQGVCVLDCNYDLDK